MNSVTTMWAVIFLLLFLGTWIAIANQQARETRQTQQSVLPQQQQLSQPPPTSLPNTPEALSIVLRKYFSTIWPNMATGTMDSSSLSKAYSMLDCWYEDFIPSLVDKLDPAQYAKDAVKTLDPVVGQYALLDGGTVCDCRGVNAEMCRNGTDRTDRDKCPPWPYFKCFLTNTSLLKRAFDSSNKSKNYTIDSIQRLNVSGRKGFPDFSYYEGMVFPGETGLPELCTSDPDAYWNAKQQGIGSGLCISNSEPPWYSLPDCKQGVDCARCVEIVSGDSIQTKCVKSNSTCPGAGGGGGDGDGVRFRINCQPDGFPKSVCENVSVADYKVLKTYPLMGCGMWWTVGRSVVANTKIGFLTDSVVGCAMDIQTLLDLCGSVVMAPYNLVQQVNRVSEILLKGTVTATQDWPGMSLLDLKMHGYSSSNTIRTKEEAYDAAKKLIKYWYSEGYTGLEAGVPNGFNYNYKKYFPIGCHYSYGNRFDNMILAFMAYKKLDTLQLVLEPQDVLRGARPAYAFEIASKIPTTEFGKNGSAFANDSSSTQCYNCYMLDPSIVAGGLTTYLDTGYIPVSSLPASLETINPKKFKARADKRSFSAS